MQDESNALLKALDEQLMRLLSGEPAGTVEYGCNLDPVLKGLCETANRFFVSFNEAHDFIQSLAEGNLQVPSPPYNLLASPFKQLQANLLHLTWQTGQIAAGDYSQRVHFMGAFSTAFNSMVVALEERTAELAVILKALRESEARYRLIVDTFDGLIYICSQDYRLEFMNKKLIERTGYEAVGELCFKVMNDMDSVCPWCVNDRVFMGETVHREMFSPKDNRWYYVANVPIDHADGSMAKHSMLFDITDRKMFEEELKLKKQLLEELNRTLEERVHLEVEKNREKDIILIQQNRQAALGEMFEDIAHQWKQPLNTIAVIIQALGTTSAQGQATNRDIPETVDSIMDMVGHMAQTVDVFRNFYKPDKEKSVFLIKDSIEKVLSFVTPVFRRLGIEVDIDADARLLAFGYPKEYAQVLLNILANAKDALIERSVENPRIRIKAFADGDNTVVTITDNAGGIPCESIERIFDLYFTTKESSGGAGIGLYMSKNIIEKNMGGKLSVRNSDNGAQFRIEIGKSSQGEEQGVSL